MKIVRSAQLSLLIFAMVPACGGAPSSEVGYYPDMPLARHVAYLTFDDGPDQWTGNILDTLAANDIKATFFINAYNLKSKGLDGTYFDPTTGTQASYADMLRRTVAAGHAIGNHTEHHLDLATLDSATIAQEFDDNRTLMLDEIVKNGGPSYPLRLMRPPFGSPWFSPSLGANRGMLESSIGAEIVARGENILWNVDSTDSTEWVNGEWFVSNDANPIHVYDPTTAEFQQKITRIENAVLSSSQVHAGDGVVVLFHDTHPTTRDALQPVIDGLRAAGYTFDTIENLIGCPTKPAPYDAAWCSR